MHWALMSWVPANEPVSSPREPKRQTARAEELYVSAWLVSGPYPSAPTSSGDRWSYPAISSRQQSDHLISSLLNPNRSNV
ncbi:hypothetical protein L3X38_013996 [Prunus dulcis]|uniref:Uncharacterized protein n=1 Tax=Prunus dulcis TaxID=3755 RepID=A0AAD4ZGP1_PRUDU|nr:hypothetical protein L3X38_013996 [Prunus dulcis]